MSTILLNEQYYDNKVFITEKYIAAGCQLTTHNKHKVLVEYFNPPAHLIHVYKKTKKLLDDGKIDELKIINLTKYKTKEGTYDRDNVYSLKILTIDQYLPRAYGLIEDEDKRAFILREVSDELFHKYFKYESSTCVRETVLDRVTDEVLEGLLKKYNDYSWTKYVLEAYKRWSSKTMSDVIIPNLDYLDGDKYELSKLIDAHIWMNNECSEKELVNSFRALYELDYPSLLERYAKKKEYRPFLKEVFMGLGSIKIDTYTLDIFKHLDKEALIYIYKHSYCYVDQLVRVTAKVLNVKDIKDLLLFFNTKDRFEGYQVVKELLLHLYQIDKITINE